MNDSHNTDKLSQRIAYHLAKEIGIDLRTQSPNPFWVIFERKQAGEFEFSIAKQNLPYTTDQKPSAFEAKVDLAITNLNARIASEVKLGQRNTGITSILTAIEEATKEEKIASFTISNIDSFSALIKDLCPDSPDITDLTDKTHRGAPRIKIIRGGTMVG